MAVEGLPDVTFSGGESREEVAEEKGKKYCCRRRVFREPHTRREINFSVSFPPSPVIDKTSNVV